MIPMFYSIDPMGCSCAACFMDIACDKVSRHEYVGVHVPMHIPGRVLTLKRGTGTGTWGP